MFPKIGRRTWKLLESFFVLLLFFFFFFFSFLFFYFLFGNFSFSFLFPFLGIFFLIFEESCRKYDNSEGDEAGGQWS